MGCRFWRGKSLVNLASPQSFYFFIIIFWVKCKCLFSWNLTVGFRSPAYLEPTFCDVKLLPLFLLIVSPSLPGLQWQEEFVEHLGRSYNNNKDRIKRLRIHSITILFLFLLFPFPFSSSSTIVVILFEIKIIKLSSSFSTSPVVITWKVFFSSSSGVM